MAKYFSKGILKTELVAIQSIFHSSETWHLEKKC